MTKDIYGKLPDGRPVTAYTLDNGLLKAEILDLGATLNRLYAPDRKGKMENILSTFDTLEERLAGSQYQGETVGRYANRIADARFTLHGKEYRLTPNEGNRNCLHGGGEFSRDLWRVNSCTDSEIELRYASPAGAHGFPGAVETTLRYTLAGSGLVIEYRAVSDADTVLNLTNHAYFNLAGGGDILGHELQIDAERYLPIDADSIPTGELRPVEGTAFDFRRAKPIGRDIRANDPQLAQARGYDHNFCNPKSIHVYEPLSGRRMAVTTDLPGVQLYTGNNLPNPHTAFCLETQAWPDSPNQWPEQCLLRAGETYKTATRFDFSVR
jgi:aldose 1-epimerase